LDVAAKERILQRLNKTVISKGPTIDARYLDLKTAEIVKSEQLLLLRDWTNLQAGSLDATALKVDVSVRVPSISSVIRRISIVTELGPGASEELEFDALGRYLSDTLNVPDHQSVRDSFDSSQRAEVVTLKRQTTLLRLFGGASKPVGRYFFCCLWSAESGHPHDRWSDASVLATPPENLLERLAVVTVPAGSKVVVGVVADNFADQFGLLRPGGNTQIFVPEVSNLMFREYRPADGGAAASDFVIFMDEGILRFRPKANH
jgi:hypothetical protein